MCSLHSVYLSVGRFLFVCVPRLSHFPSWNAEEAMKLFDYGPLNHTIALFTGCLFEFRNCVCVCFFFGCVTESKITDSLAHNWIACGRAITFNKIMTERLIANSSWQTWCVNHLFGLFSVNSLIFFTITVFLSESRSGKVCQTQEKGVSVPRYWVFCLMLKDPGINNIA